MGAGQAGLHVGPTTAWGPPTSGPAASSPQLCSACTHQRRYRCWLHAGALTSPE